MLGSSQALQPTPIYSTPPLKNVLNEPPLAYAPDKTLKRDYSFPLSQTVSEQTQQYAVSSSTLPSSMDSRPVLISEGVVPPTTTATYTQVPSVIAQQPVASEPVVLSSSRPMVSYLQPSNASLVTSSGGAALPMTTSSVPYQYTPVVVDRNRYGYTTINRRIPIPPIDQNIYIVNATTKGYANLFHDRTDVFFTQQVMCSPLSKIQKLLMPNKERFQWIYTAEGHIVSSVNRQIALSFKEVPHTKEILVVAKNYEILGGMLPKWRIVPAAISPFMRVAPEHQLCYICLYVFYFVKF